MPPITKVIAATFSECLRGQVEDLILSLLRLASTAHGQW